MLRALWTAATGMGAQQTNIDVIANNLANVNTTGFKRGRADFQDLLYQTLRLAGTTASAGNEIPTGIQIGLGSRVVAVADQYSQGDFKQTDNPLDLTIEGKGFFQIIKPDGDIAYTRSGAFKIDGDGRIVNSDGLPLEPEITIPDDTVQITVGLDGTVNVLPAGETEPAEVGTIETVTFANPQGLVHLGHNLLDESEASGAPITGTPGEDGHGTIAQGFLEMSNTKVVEEMVNMIVAQRAYEINSKVIQTSDDMLQVANNLKR